MSLETFADWQGTVNGVTIKSCLPLPEYVPMDQVSIDVGNIALMARWGRLATVKFGLYDESSKTSAKVSGINSDGSATGVAMRTQSVPRAKGSSTNSADTQTYPPGFGLTYINTDHPDLDNAILRQPKPWADLLDRGVRSGLTQACRHQLLCSPGRIAYASANGAWDAIAVGALWSIFRDPALIYSVVAVAKLSDVVGVGAMYKNDLLEKSLVPGYPIDRYIAVKGLAATRRFAFA